MRRLLAALLVVLAGSAFGQASEIANPDPATEARLKALAEELRCLVCQNQTIADSNAPLALDLRNEIREMIAKGQGDDQIRAYMVQRYGDFVLYRPPWKPVTLILWIGPFALLGAGAVILVVMVRRRRGKPSAPPEADRANCEEVEKLLKG